MRPCISLCRGAAVFAVFFILPLRRFWGNTCNLLRLRHDIMYFLQIENQNLSITELKLRLSLCRICLSSPKMQNPLQISMLRIVLRFSPNLCKKVSAIKYQARKLLPCCIPATQKKPDWNKNISGLAFLFHAFLFTRLHHKDPRRFHNYSSLLVYQPGHNLQDSLARFGAVSCFSRNHFQMYRISDAQRRQIFLPLSWNSQNHPLPETAKK